MQKKLLKTYKSSQKTEKYIQNGVIFFEKHLSPDEAFKQYVGNRIQNYLAKLLDKKPFAPYEEISCSTQSPDKILLTSYELEKTFHTIQELIEIRITEVKPEIEARFKEQNINTEEFVDSIFYTEYIRTFTGTSLVSTYERSNEVVKSNEIENYFEFFVVRYLLRLQDNHLSNFGLIKNLLYTVDGDRHFEATPPDKFTLVHQHIDYSKIFNNNVDKVLQIIDNLIEKIDINRVKNIEDEALHVVSGCTNKIDTQFTTSFDIRLKYLAQAKGYLKDAVQFQLFTQIVQGKYPSPYDNQFYALRNRTKRLELITKYVQEVHDYILTHYKSVSKPVQDKIHTPLNKYYDIETNIKFFTPYWGEVASYDLINLKHQKLIHFFQEHLFQRPTSKSGLYLYGMFKNIPDEITDAQLGFTSQNKYYEDTIMGALLGSFLYCNEKMFSRTLPYLEQYNILDNSEANTLSTVFLEHCDVPNINDAAQDITGVISSHNEL